ncbi:MAG: hypothetical protein LBL45_12745 [Treponema sp.]|nr:hypothetical protein [Treponema sp.]
MDKTGKLEGVYHAPPNRLRGAAIGWRRTRNFAFWNKINDLSMLEGKLLPLAELLALRR